MIDTNDFITELGENLIQRITDDGCSQMANMEILSNVRRRVVDTDCLVLTLIRTAIISCVVILIDNLLCILCFIDIKVEVTAYNLDFT